MRLTKLKNPAFFNPLLDGWSESRADFQKEVERHSSVFFSLDPTAKTEASLRLDDLLLMVV